STGISFVSYGFDSAVLARAVEPGKSRRFRVGEIVALDVRLIGGRRDMHRLTPRVSLNRGAYRLSVRGCLDNSWNQRCYLPADIASQQGTFAGKNNPLVAFGRLDYQLSPKHTLNLQYTYAAQFGLTFNGPTGQTNAAVTNNLALDRASQGIKGALTSVLSPNLINEVR